VIYFKTKREGCMGGKSTFGSVFRPCQYGKNLICCVQLQKTITRNQYPLPLADTKGSTLPSSLFSLSFFPTSFNLPKAGGIYLSDF
jgi:hypothetical protein